MISNYNLEKGYNIGSLQHHIYLYDRSMTTLYFNDDYTIGGLNSSNSYYLKVDNISFNVTSKEENRYLFQSELSVKICEREDTSNLTILKTILDGDWVIGVEALDGSKFVVNPEFAPLITYKYVINDNSYTNDLDVTMTFNQNIPCSLFLGNFTAFKEYDNTRCQYQIGSVKSLKIGYYEDVIVKVKGNGFEIISSNDAMKSIDWIKGSFEYSSEYDGSEFIQEISFTIPWKAYKHHFHFELLEFAKNKYISTIHTTNDNFIISGFKNGMLPSYSISSGEDNNPNTIKIVLTQRSSSFPELMSDEIEFKNVDIPNYIAVEGECIDGVYAVTVIGEINDDGNLTGNYYALRGYGSGYNIIDRYDSIYDSRFGIKLYDEGLCGKECVISNMPQIITFNNVGETKNIAITSDCELSVNYNSINCDCALSSTGLTITNKSDKPYYITIVDSLGVEHIIQVMYVDDDKVMESHYSVTAEGQELDVIPVNGVDDIVLIDSPLDFDYNRGGNGLLFIIPENKDEEDKTYVITITYKTGKVEYVNIKQNKVYKIVYADGLEQCIGNDLWSMSKVLYGYYEDDITLDGGYIPYSLKVRNSTSCYDENEYTKDVLGEIVVDGKVYEITEYMNDNQEYQFIKLIPTDRDGEGDAAYEKWVIDESATYCEDGQEYYFEYRWVSNDDIDYYLTDQRRKSNITSGNKCDVIEKNATTLYRWVNDGDNFYCFDDAQEINCSKVEDSDKTICIDGNLYSAQEEFIDVTCNGIWVSCGLIPVNIIEENSNECDE